MFYAQLQFEGRRARLDSVRRRQPAPQRPVTGVWVTWSKGALRRAGVRLFSLGSRWVAKWEEAMSLGPRPVSAPRSLCELWQVITRNWRMRWGPSNYLSKAKTSLFEF